MIISGTGHRPNKLGNDYTYKSPLCQNIMKCCIKLIETYKPSEIISGMALGFDTMWALMALKCHIPLICAIPHPNQHKVWPKASRDLYERILSHAESIVYVTSGPYEKGCEQKRNEWMVDRGNLLFGIHDGSFGGTYNCIEYAKDRGKQTLIINPKDLMYEFSICKMPDLQST